VGQRLFAVDREGKDHDFLENQILLLGPGRSGCRRDQRRQEKNRKQAL
jgi:hypothetical protein